MAQKIPLADWGQTLHGKTGMTMERRRELFLNARDRAANRVFGHPEMKMPPDLFQPESDEGDPAFWLLVDEAKRTY